MLFKKWKITYRSPKLKIDFKLAVPGCHLTKQGDSPTYYFRFLVENIGKTQANECEVLIERIFKENSARKMIEFKNFSPVNLKWSG
jgi:hypothetical protein